MQARWLTDGERRLGFRRQLYNKDFRRISTFLRNRTVADCVVYYYKRQKDTNGFRRKTQLKKRRQYIEAKRTAGGLNDGGGYGGYGGYGGGGSGTGTTRSGAGGSSSRPAPGQGTARQEAVRGKGMSPQMLSRPSGGRGEKADDGDGKKAATRSGGGGGGGAGGRGGEGKPKGRSRADNTLKAREAAAAARVRKAAEAAAAAARAAKEAEAAAAAAEEEEEEEDDDEKKCTLPKEYTVSQGAAATTAAGASGVKRSAAAASLPTDAARLLGAHPNKRPFESSVRELT